MLDVMDHCRRERASFYNEQTNRDLKKPFPVCYNIIRTQRGEMAPDFLSNAAAILVYTPGCIATTTLGRPTFNRNRGLFRAALAAGHASIPH